MPYKGSLQNKADKAKWQRKWRKENPSMARKIWDNWQDKTDYDVKANHRRMHLAKYKITQNDYEQMVINQNGLCLVCKCPAKNEPLVIDHNHLSGKIRGLLHRQCNAALGLLKDSPTILRTAAEYIENNAMEE